MYRQPVLQPEGQTILMVDDTPANLGVLAHVLEENGLRVLVAQDGDEAFARAQRVRPDLILLDVMMPGIDGFETCRRLKAAEETQDIPVIFMTALQDHVDKLAGFDAGAVDYVTKPFDVEEVLARVRTHLSLRLMRRQLEQHNDVLQQQVALRERAEASLRSAYDELERRVVERTSELAQANEQLLGEINERQRIEETLRDKEARVRYIATHDGLTALPNRNLLQDRLRQAIAHAHRDTTQVALLFIDLDYFKNINDSLGHHIGDCVLQIAARRLQECVREDDSVGRLGGDEFVLILHLPNDGSHAALVAQKALEALVAPFNCEGHELHVSASIGISLFPGDGRDVETLMRNADTAMYHAKEQGRGNFQFFTPALNRAAQRRLTLGNALRNALTHGELTLHYQPQVDIVDGRIFSAEALLRWNGQNSEGIPCIEFITVAEETGLILQIGEWVLREACNQLRAWHELGYGELSIAVNLSPRQFFQPDFLGMVRDVLRESGIAPGALDLEITEGMLMQRTEENMATLRQLSSMGVKLSVDDFGTGYSSLAYLQRFPVDALKIDRSFISGIDQDRDHTALVGAIISMAHSLRLKVLAEGVETPGQVRFLQSHGCRSAQGFYYSEPVPAEEFTLLLQRQRRMHG